MTRCVLCGKSVSKRRLVRLQVNGAGYALHMACVWAFSAQLGLHVDETKWRDQWPRGPIAFSRGEVGARVH